jgi:acetamidase/formamidase
MAHSFHVHSAQAHLKWSRAIPPVLTVPSGAEITFDLRDGGNNQIRPDNAATALHDFDFAQTDPAFGPVHVEGAEPGDVLRVEFLELAPGAYGWTAILPGFGLLADEFPEPQLKIWDLAGIGPTGSTAPGESKMFASDDSNAAGASGTDGGGGGSVARAVFKPGISIPVRPFLGVVGVAPEAAGDFSTIPPSDTGGNMDCRHLVAGSTLWLPVKVAGALLSCGDGHAAQGDGEVCGTAIETPMRARMRVTVEKDRPWVTSPHFVTPGAAATSTAVAGPEYAALGIDADLAEATRKALRGLMGWLVAEKGLTRVESYMLSSVAASLKMVEVVDMPHFAVACAIPLDIFTGSKTA